MQVPELLIALLESAISRDSDLASCVVEFETVYWQLSDQETAQETLAWKAINNFAEQLEYFEPGADGQPALYGERGLLQRIKNVLNEIRASN
jgi:hypothetical protein